MTKSSLGRAKRKAARKSASTGEVRGVSGRQLVGVSSCLSMDIPLEKLGHPGSLTELHVVPQFLGDNPNDQSRLVETTEREFETAALLSKAPTPSNALTLDFGEADGNSYFIFASPAMTVDTLWGVVRIGKNTSGEASLITMTCRARSANEALERLQLACATFLDNWAYEMTAPVYLTMLRARDLKTQVLMARFASPYRQSKINPLVTEIPTPLRPAFALYREALCSASPLYKFLCFYKILEGYFSRLKPDLAKIFRGAKLKYPEAPECVPDHPELAAEFRAYIGQSIAKFRDEQLIPNFRSAVAHFEPDDSSPIVTSNPYDILRFNHAALAVELCARTVIESYRRAFQEAVAASLDLSSLCETSVAD